MGILNGGSSLIDDFCYLRKRFDRFEVQIFAHVGSVGFEKWRGGVAVASRNNFDQVPRTGGPCKDLGD